MFHKFAEQWKTKKATQVKEYSIKKSCERFEKPVYPYIAKVPVKDLKRQQIINFLRPLEKCGKLDTLKCVVSLINQILNFAIDCGALEYKFKNHKSLCGASRTTFSHNFI
ncbi:phage integrase central domain-containing protein [Gilliamella sp. B2785]|uniref:phage integrase central domain-containing protein n=1 Tax=Gilliamella sp. B2785 TaxID=2817982 RepID=UPI003A5CABD9